VHKPNQKRTNEQLLLAVHELLLVTLVDRH
jgi:hypothetical protein